MSAVFPARGHSCKNQDLTPTRYHSLDALRAAMMLLGLVLHSAASYIQAPIGAAWPYHDAQRHPFFDLLIVVIHLFRMPVFFVMAGFFAALLYDRDGPSGFMRNRARRVLLPLVTFWPFVIPLTVLGFAFALGGRKCFVLRVPFVDRGRVGPGVFAGFVCQRIGDANVREVYRDCHRAC